MLALIKPSVQCPTRWPVSKGPPGAIRAVAFFGPVLLFRLHRAEIRSKIVCTRVCVCVCASGFRLARVYRVWCPVFIIRDPLVKQTSLSGSLLHAVHMVRRTVPMPEKGC